MTPFVRPLSAGPRVVVSSYRVLCASIFVFIGLLPLISSVSFSRLDQPGTLSQFNLACGITDLRIASPYVSIFFCCQRHPAGVRAYMPVYVWRMILSYVCYGTYEVLVYCWFSGPKCTCYLLPGVTIPSISFVRLRASLHLNSTWYLVYQVPGR